MKPSKKILVLLLALSPIVAWSLSLGFWSWAMNGPAIAFTAAQKENFQLWRTEKLTLPEAAVSVKPFTEDALAAAQHYYETWGEYEQAALKLDDLYQNYRLLDSASDQAAAQWNEISAQLLAIEPLLEAFREMVRQEEYTVNVLVDVAGIADQSKGIGAYAVSCRCGVRMLALKTHALLKEGKDAEALANAEAIVLTSRAEPYSPLLVAMISIAGYSIGVEAWREAVEHCRDPELLRQTLERQNDLGAPTGFLTRDIPVEVHDQIGLIRIAQRQGLEVDIQGLTGSEIYGEGIRAQQFLNKDNTIDPTNQAAIDALTPRGTSLFAKLGMNYSLVILYRISLTSSEVFYFRDDVARVKFDLLRLYTAQKLYRLEQGREPEQISDLVPAYLPEIPQDIFSKDGQSFLFNNSTATPFFYSVGPDGKDQQGAQQYRAGIGIIAGDIFFNPPAQKDDK